MEYARTEENHVPMDPTTIQDGQQYWTWDGQTYGTVYAIDGQIVSEEGQVYMCIDDPAWKGATRWVDASSLASAPFPLSSEQAEKKRREIEGTMEQLGTEMGMDGRCTAGWYETGAVFETPEGNVHLFTFPPTLGYDE